ncbi:MAG: hypothetical protein OXC71_03775 [Chloroflexi bacterium]|nr:hypothetical protein [Chloroflexota bacterium]
MPVAIDHPASARCRAATMPGLTVVELRTDRERNVAQHREAWARVDAALRDAEAGTTPSATAATQQA